MDTISEVMTELLIDQDGRLEENRALNPVLFTVRARKAERLIIDGAEGATDVNKN